MTFTPFSILISVLWTVLTIGFSIIYFRNRSKGIASFRTFYKDVEMDKVPPAGSEAHINENLDFYLTVYDDHSKRIRKNFQIHAVFILATIGILTSAKDATLFDTEIKLSYALPILGCVLVYSWLGLGYLLAVIIRLRYVIWNIIEKTDNQFGIESDSIFSRKSALNPGPFETAWFATFNDDTMLEYLPKIFRTYYISVVMITAVLYGLGHACVTAAPCWLLSSETGEPVFWYTVGVGVVLLYGLSHFNFMVKGRNRNWFQLVVLSSATIGSLWLGSEATMSAEEYRANQDSGTKVEKVADPKTDSSQNPAEPEAGN